MSRLSEPSAGSVSIDDLDELSVGESQRTFIAMVLCQDTRYVFLDEPLDNMDMNQAAAMMGMIRRAADELGSSRIIYAA